MLLTGREGSWEGVFLVFNVNQETAGMWMGGKRKEIGGWGRNFCSRWCRDTKGPIYIVRVCVYERGWLMLPYISFLFLFIYF